VSMTNRQVTVTIAFDFDGVPACAVCGRHRLTVRWTDTDTGRSVWACLRHTFRARKVIEQAVS
jgi:hypothetical protein